MGRDPARHKRHDCGSSLDAVRAARQAFIEDHPLTPRRRGDREALRVLSATRHSACVAKVSATSQLKALSIGRPAIVLARLRDDPATRAYAARRRGEAKSVREIRRCSKRAVARQLFKLLEHCDRSSVDLLRVT